MASSGSHSPLQAARALHEAGHASQAFEIYQKILEADPDNPEVLYLAGLLLHQNGRPEITVDLLARALRQRPDHVDGHLLLASAHLQLRRAVPAIASLQTAFALRPGDPSIACALGAALRNLGRLAEADDLLTRAIELHPRHADLRLNRGVVLADQGRPGEALADFQRVLELHPDHLPAWQNYLLGLHRLPDYSPEALFREHARFGHQFPGTPRRHAPDPHALYRPLRVGYLSPDFRDHSVSFFIEPILACHDREQFHITCYSTTDRPDSVTRRLRGLARQWRDVPPHVNDQTFAAGIAMDQIDLLVDLAGHTSHRLTVLSHRPAPIQVTYLGYPNTTGAPWVDYRLTDAHADPPGGADAFHTERLCRLENSAWCYRPPQNAPEVSPPPSLQSGLLTFGSFNSFAKVNEFTLDLWSEVLKAVPDARLLLKSAALGDPSTGQRALAAFALRGIAPGRLEFLGHQSSASDHLAAYRQVDIALDPFPYHGTTTTCEALHMGVPVLTLAGNHHAARVGVSLLGQVGLSDLVAPDAAAYVQIARRLAADPAQRATWRSALRQKLAASSLGDERGFTLRLESLYRRLWIDWCTRPLA